MSTIISAGVDLGSSGKTAFHVVVGQNFRLKTVYQHSIVSVRPQQVEEEIQAIYTQFNPDVFLMESNGPGAIFLSYVHEHLSHIPIVGVDTSSSPPEEGIFVWDDMMMNNKTHLNMRAIMYWIVHLLLRDQRLSLLREDAELFVQLTSTYWEFDKTRGDKLKITPKRNLRITGSEFEGLDFSKSPDKADACALSCLGYTLLAQEDILTQRNPVKQEEEVIEPEFDGFFEIGKLLEF